MRVVIHEFPYFLFTSSRPLGARSVNKEEVKETTKEFIYKWNYGEFGIS